MEQVWIWLADTAKKIAALGVVGTAVGVVIWWTIRRFIDSRLETKLAAYKGELEREAERLRHDLQREMLKAQLGTSRMYEIAPVLLVKAKKAYSALNSVMGLSFAPNWSEYNRRDLEAAFDDRKLFPLSLLTSLRERILSDWDSASPGLNRAAVEEVGKLFFQQQVGNAGRLARRAHNYAVLNVVLLPADLAKFATETTIALVRSHIDAQAVLIDRAGDMRKARQDLTAIEPRIEELETRIRSVLSPAAASMPTTGAPRAAASGAGKPSADATEETDRRKQDS